MPPKTSTTRVFVYGTLKTGHGNWNSYLAPAVGVRAETVAQNYVMHTNGSFPMVRRAATTDPMHVVTEIHGEVFDVDADTLAMLDGLEGHPNWYRREEIDVELAPGVTTRAWIYLMPRDGCRDAPIIEDGIFGRRRRFDRLTRRA